MRSPRAWLAPVVAGLVACTGGGAPSAPPVVAAPDAAPAVDARPAADAIGRSCPALEVYALDDEWPMPAPTAEGIAYAVEAAGSVRSVRFWAATSEAILRAAVGGVRLPKGRRILLGWGAIAPDEPRFRTYVITGASALSSADLRGVRREADLSGQPAVWMELSPEAARRFADFTAAHVRRRVAIVLEERVHSAPLVMSRIDGGRLQLSLGAASADAEGLAEGLGRCGVERR